MIKGLASYGVKGKRTFTQYAGLGRESENSEAQTPHTPNNWSMWGVVLTLHLGYLSRFENGTINLRLHTTYLREYDIRPRALN